MTRERSELRSAARTLVWGTGGLVAAYLLLRPLAAHVSVVASGLLLAVALWALASVLCRHARMPYRVAVVLVLIIVALLLSALSAWMGPLLAEQLSELQEAVIQGVANAQAWLESTPTGRTLLARLQENLSSMGDGGDVLGGVSFRFACSFRTESALSASSARSSFRRAVRSGRRLEPADALPPRVPPGWAARR